MYGAKFRAKVLAECRQPGVTVAAVALAHGLNVNLVRKWLVGRGLMRDGLAATKQIAARPAAMQFVPIEVAKARVIEPRGVGSSAMPEAASVEPPIHVELRCGNAQLTVRGPSWQAQACAASHKFPDGHPPSARPGRKDDNRCSNYRTRQDLRFVQPRWLCLWMANDRNAADISRTGCSDCRQQPLPTSRPSSVPVPPQNLLPPRLTPTHIVPSSPPGQTVSSGSSGTGGPCSLSTSSSRLRTL